MRLARSILAAYLETTAGALSDVARALRRTHPKAKAPGWLKELKGNHLPVEPKR